MRSTLPIVLSYAKAYMSGAISELVPRAARSSAWWGLLPLLLQQVYCLQLLRRWPRPDLVTLRLCGYSRGIVLALGIKHRVKSLVSHSPLHASRLRTARWMVAVAVQPDLIDKRKTLQDRASLLLYAKC